MNAFTVQRFRKKPVEIEAVLWNAMNGWDEALALADWCGGTAVRDENPEDRLKSYYWCIEIPAREGTMTARCGDYIIKGVEDEFYPCKKDIFEKTYEVVSA